MQPGDQENLLYSTSSRDFGGGSRRLARQFMTRAMEATRSLAIGGGSAKEY